MSRKTLVISLVAILLLAACGGGQAPAPTTAPAGPAPTAAATAPPTEAPTAAPTEAPTVAPTEAPTAAAVMTATVAATTTAPAGAAVGDAAAGKALFAQTTLGKDNLPGCSTCHSVEPGKTIVGPSLAGIATDAAGSVSEEGYEGKAKDAAGWLREAIVSPDIDVPEGFPAKVMPQNFGTELTDQQINDLIAYLLTLK